MNNGFVQINEFPESFRQKLIGDIFAKIKKGQSIQLIGATGSGKSIVLRAIVQAKNIQKFQLGTNINQFVFTFADFKFVVDKKLKSVLSFLNSKLGTAIPKGDVPSQVNSLENFVSNITNSKKHYVIIIDSFNELQNPARFFEILKGLYDQNRGRLSFIFAVNHEVDIDKHFIDFKNLTSILTENLIYIPPLGHVDYDWFTTQLENYLGLNLNKRVKDLVYKETGGFMATIKRVLESLRDGNTIEDIIRHPDKNQRITYHFQTFLKDIDQEKDTLFDAINNRIKKGKNLNYLIKIGVLNENGRLLIPLLKTYIKNVTSIESNSLQERITDRISIKTRITALEFKVLKYLCNRIEEFCTRDEIIEIVWGTKAVNGISDHALDQLIYRLRKKLDQNDPQLKIKTVWGRGHKATLLS